MTNTVKTPHKLLMILLFASLAVMLGAALVGRFTDPHLVMQTPHAAQQQAQGQMMMEKLGPEIIRQGANLMNPSQ